MSQIIFIIKYHKEKSFKLNIWRFLLIPSQTNQKNYQYNTNLIISIFQQSCKLRPRKLYTLSDGVLLCLKFKFVYDTPVFKTLGKRENTAWEMAPLQI